jgi:hypothetical protein
MIFLLFIKNRQNTVPPSVADPDHFDADPYSDLTYKKTGSGSCTVQKGQNLNLS